MQHNAEHTPTKKAMVMIELKECPRNLLFRYRLEDYLQANGYSIIVNSDVDSVDLTDCEFIFFTACATMVPIRDEQLRYIRIAQEEIQRQNSPATLVVTGCLPHIEAEAVAAVHDGPIIGQRDTEKFDTLISARVPMAEIPNRHHLSEADRRRNLIYEKDFIDRFSKLSWLAGGLSVLSGKKQEPNIIHRYQNYSPAFQSLTTAAEPTPVHDDAWLVTTSTGCMSRCSYCSVWRSRGKLKSRPLPVLLQEIEQGVRQGYSWVSLIADDNGVYGADCNSSFSELLTAVQSLPGDFGLMIEGIKPADFNDAIDALLAWSEAGRPLCAMLSVQHMNQRILNSMGRPCDMELFKKNLKALVQGPGLFVPGFHSMVGYPGETEAEFQELLDFVAWFKKLELRGGYTWVSFVFSPNPGTPAATMPDQVPEQVRIERGRRLTKAHESDS